MVWSDKGVLYKPGMRQTFPASSSFDDGDVVQLALSGQLGGARRLTAGDRGLSGDDCFLRRYHDPCLIYGGLGVE